VPTIITHALLPLIAGAAAKPKVSTPLIFAGMAAAILPDGDLVSRLFGIPHTADLGHRGVSHTLLFALLIGSLAAWAAPLLKARRRIAGVFVFAATLSHPLTDMLTDGGKGMMLFWPVSHDRFRWPETPVEVSSIGLRSLYDGSIGRILLSELLWLILPALFLATLYRLATRPHIDLDRGPS
jgi:inner membrane protein